MNTLVTKCTGKDEWWCNWFICPSCGVNNIASKFDYCPECGIKLTWPTDKTMIDGYESR